MNDRKINTLLDRITILRWRVTCMEKSHKKYSKFMKPSKNRMKEIENLTSEIKDILKQFRGTITTNPTKKLEINSLLEAYDAGFKI